MSKTPYLMQPDPSYIARKLCSELNVYLEAAIDIEHILDELNIVIRYKEIRPDILGACKVKGLNKFVIINPNIDNVGRMRFTIAHEIGHLILHHGIALCTEKDLNINITKKNKEMQANMFASELLLPHYPLKKILDKKDLTIELIQEISNKYKTSLTATAIKLVSICDEQVAIFYQKDNMIHWGVKSPVCMYKIEREDVKTTSIASRFNKEKIIDSGYVDSYSWFVDVSDYIDCFEETIYFNNLNSYLTIARLEDSD